jgi:hypothetical protein
MRRVRAREPTNLHVSPARAQMQDVTISYHAGMPTTAAAIAGHVCIALLPIQATKQTKPRALCSGRLAGRVHELAACQRVFILAVRYFSCSTGITGSWRRRMSIISYALSSAKYRAGHKRRQTGAAAARVAVSSARGLQRSVTVCGLLKTIYYGKTVHSDADVEHRCGARWQNSLQAPAHSPTCSLFPTMQARHLLQSFVHKSAAAQPRLSTTDVFTQYVSASNRAPNPPARQFVQHGLSRVAQCARLLQRRRVLRRGPCPPVGRQIAVKWGASCRTQVINRAEANKWHLRSEVVDGGSKPVLLHAGLLVARIDGWLQRQRLTKFALSSSGSSAVVRKRFFDCSEAVAVQHQVPQHAVESGLAKKKGRGSNMPSPDARMQNICEYAKRMEGTWAFASSWERTSTCFSSLCTRASWRKRALRGVSRVRSCSANGPLSSRIILESNACCLSASMCCSTAIDCQYSAKKST